MDRNRDPLKELEHRKAILLAMISNFREELSMQIEIVTTQGLDINHKGLLEKLDQFVDELANVRHQDKKQDPCTNPDKQKNLKILDGILNMAAQAKLDMESNPLMIDEVSSLDQAEKVVSTILKTSKMFDVPASEIQRLEKIKKTNNDAKKTDGAAKSQENNGDQE